MANNKNPSPDNDPWFNLPNVKSSAFVADFTTDSQGLFYGKIGARDYETDPSIPLTVIDVDDQWHVDVHLGRRFRHPRSHRSTDDVDRLHGEIGPGERWVGGR